MWKRARASEKAQWWRRRNLDPPRPPEHLVDNEFDAFLAGQYADWVIQLDEPVPVWAWVNRLAHATPLELRAMAAQPFASAARPDLIQWECAVRVLARAVLAAMADDEIKLSRIQTEVLVPAELSLASQWHTDLIPSQLAVRVATAVQTGSWADNSR